MLINNMNINTDPIDIENIKRFMAVNSRIQVNWKNYLKIHILRLAWWLSAKESACQCKCYGFDPWSGKIPHALEQLSPQATTTEPVPYIPEPQLLSPSASTTEAHALYSMGSPREATAMRSLSTTTRKYPLLAMLGKSPRSNKDSAQPKINK